MKEWIEEHYPGTKLAITEYNFGALDHVTGAVTQADVLGIFGREGVDMATIWASPNPDEPVAYAYRMYRNYDGLQQETSRFGSNSIEAISADSNVVSVFAATRNADSALTVMLINKSRQPRITPLNFPGVSDATAQTFVYGATDRFNIRQLADVEIQNGQADMTLERESITLLEFSLDSNVLLGDVNLDGVVNLLDVGPFVDRLSSGTYQAEADTNQDGQLNLLDVGPFIDILSG